MDDNINFKHHWMPFTANRDFKKSPRVVAKAEGAYYWDNKGNKILDGISGLFNCPAGHGRQEIIDAVTQQLKKCDYNPHFNMANEISCQLTEKLAEVSPPNLKKFFFCCSGSESIDTAMKIVRNYWMVKGQASKQMFISRERAYHGVNWGGTSLSGMVNNRKAFGLGLPGIAHIRHTWVKENRFIKNQPPHQGVALANDLQRMVELYGAENIGACFIEPIAGSFGTLVPPTGYLERIREICTTNDILLVYDEVITGFGRTGKAFASQTFNVMPDIMTMAKAITNGSVPMGAIAVSDNIYDVLTSNSPENAVEMFHGYTYSAHPVACAAGIATMDIFKNEKLFEKGASLSPYFLDKMFELKKFDVITDIRGFGMIAAFDLAVDETPGKRGRDFYQQLFHQGLHLRATGDAIIIAPPLISEKKHIDELFEKLHNKLNT